jgi:hypothetical protein
LLPIAVSFGWFPFCPEWQLFWVPSQVGWQFDKSFGWAEGCLVGMFWGVCSFPYFDDDWDVKPALSSGTLPAGAKISLIQP